MCDSANGEQFSSPSPRSLAACIPIAVATERFFVWESVAQPPPRGVHFERNRREGGERNCKGGVQGERIGWVIGLSRLWGEHFNPRRCGMEWDRVLPCWRANLRSGWTIGV